MLIAPGCVIVATVVAVHPLASLATTASGPALNPVAVVDVWLEGVQAYVKPVKLPPPARTDAVPSLPPKHNKVV